MRALRRARTTGDPTRLTQARTFQARILFDDDDDPSTPPVEYDTLGDVVRAEPGFETQTRADVRFGRGSNGELYWSSKRNGLVYLITNSVAP